MTTSLFRSFESSVNSEYSKTLPAQPAGTKRFESSVNSEYSKTTFDITNVKKRFESSVNSDVKFNNRNINFPAKSFLFAVFYLFFYYFNIRYLKYKGFLIFLLN